MSLGSNHQSDSIKVRFDEATSTYRTTHDWDDPGRLTLTIIQTVATAIGADPESMEPLYSVLDPDAICDLMNSANDETVRLSFTYQACSVTVQSSGQIAVSTPA